MVICIPRPSGSCDLKPFLKLWRLKKSLKSDSNCCWPCGSNRAIWNRCGPVVIRIAANRKPRFKTSKCLGVWGGGGQTSWLSVCVCVWRNRSQTESLICRTGPQEQRAVVFHLLISKAYLARTSSEWSAADVTRWHKVSPNEEFSEIFLSTKIINFTRNSLKVSTFDSRRLIGHKVAFNYAINSQGLIFANVLCQRVCLSPTSKINSQSHTPKSADLLRDPGSDWSEESL